MNDSQHTLFERPVFSSRPNSQPDPRRSHLYDLVPGKTETSTLDPLLQWKGESPLQDDQRTVQPQSQKTLRVTHCSQDTSKSMPQSRPALAHGQVLFKKLLHLCNAHKGNKLSPFHHDHAAGTHGGLCCSFPC